MKHARKDYDQIQDPRGLIPEDEPVFLLRAQDVTAPEVVEFWVILARRHGADRNILQAAEEQVKRMRKWQKEHKVKIPNMPLI